MLRSLAPKFLLSLLALGLLCEGSAAQTKAAKVTRHDTTRIKSVAAPVRKLAPEMRPLAIAAEKAFLELGAAFTEGDAEKATALMDEGEILFQLEPPQSDASLKDEEPLRSHQQVFYLLKAFFAQHSIEESHCPCPQDFDNPDSAHGVPELALDDSSLRRFYVRLRRVEHEWRVSELRALP
ncbi:MAG TPA: hypothetical protein VKA63_02940 [Candidatus Krumholzibacteria bacterium]|nr:hypothetical protein [Candidatus Krumholzibacteria bacterium]